MEKVDLARTLAATIDSIVPYLLVIASVLTLTGNFAAKRFFDDCGFGLRLRYGCAVIMGGLGVVFLAGFRTSLASNVMIGTLFILSALALRTGSKWKAATMTLLAALLLFTEFA